MEKLLKIRLLKRISFCLFQIFSFLVERQVNKVERIMSPCVLPFCFATILYTSIHPHDKQQQKIKEKR